jgi:hypothetical protein
MFLSPSTFNGFIDYPSGRSLNIRNKANGFGLTLDSTGAATFSSTVTSGDFYTNGNNKGLYFNGTRNAILGNAALEEVYIGTANVIRVTIASTGAATFSSSVTAINYVSNTGSTNTPSYVLNRGSASFDGVISWTDNTSPRWKVGTFGTGSGDLRFYSANTGDYALTLNYGTGAATFSSLGTGTVIATAGTLSTVSDSSYKINDGFIDSAIEKVLNLKPRYFYWNEKSGLPMDIRQLGFYAQEVNKALGEEAANTPQNENTPWGISDRSMIAMLTKAIQEQQEIINDLKQKIA